jgi:hypothetical protein
MHTRPSRPPHAPNDALQRLLQRMRMRLHTFGMTGLVLGLWTFVSGCSVFLAATQPPRKNTALFAPGTHRSALVAEFGIPIRSRLVDFKRIDVFTFIQGYSPESRAGRAIAHGAADVLTGGFWEMAATPTEMAFSGEKVSFEVMYDSADRVTRISRLAR